jgi:argininosuccinate lyase
MSQKLWQNSASGALNPLIEAYTVGDDYKKDYRLLKYDIAASKAHAMMLESIGILDKKELKQLITELDMLLKLWEAGKFEITQNQEDGHTAIEQYLTDKLGTVGKKLHTGRSRNDQSLVMMRLYLKDHLQQTEVLLGGLVKALQAAAQRAGDTPMPGYTHLQKAMPTTVSIWLNSFADGFADSKYLIDATLKLIDQNPLGSAAGFGVSLGIDRDHTTKTLGFKKTQENTMYCGLSRGLFDLIAVQSLLPIMVLAGKFAQDMLLFTTEEFGFFSLPDSFTTGSSIMPHKHNYDLFEIMRGHAHSFSSYTVQLHAISGGMASGYQRDLQLTKGITLRAFTTAMSTISVLAAAASELKINEAKLASAITPEMLSVNRINDLVAQGVPFRDAYSQVKLELHKLD